MSDVKLMFAKAKKEGAFTDVKFSCMKEDASGKVIVEAHKTILMLASPVFAKMFSPETEQFTVQEEIIEITDIHAKTFEAFIDIIYGEPVTTFTDLMAIELYYAAEKYDVPCAKTLAKSMLHQIMPKQGNRFLMMYYELFEKYGNHEFQEICLKYIEHNIQLLLESGTYLTCLPATLVKIFGLNNLQVKSEFALVEAYCKYVEKNQQAKEDVVEALKNIRFLTMPIKDLIRVNLFTDEQLVTIVKIATFNESEEKMPLSLSTNRSKRGSFPLVANEDGLKLIKMTNYFKCCIHSKFVCPKSDLHKRFQAVYNKYYHLNVYIYTLQDYEEIAKIFNSLHF